MAARLAADTAPEAILRWPAPSRRLDGIMGRLAAWAGAIEAHDWSTLQARPEPDRLVNRLRRAGLL